MKNKIIIVPFFRAGLDDANLMLVFNISLIISSLIITHSKRENNIQCNKSDQKNEGSVAK